jgi:hypothetical protein
MFNFITTIKIRLYLRILLGLLVPLAIIYAPLKVFAITNPQNGGIGLQGIISEPPPTRAVTITSPATGASFTSMPVTVVGWCPSNLLIRVFSNGIFTGSVMCINNSYSVKTDLFSGTNDLTAIDYDSLDQAGPVSNTVRVTFNDNTANANVANLVSLSSNYARRGADPDQTLTWPIIISGGIAPYALGVDWGDGSGSDLYTATVAGAFTVQHIYKQSGTYSVLIKAADSNGTTAYLQLVAVANGQVTEPTPTTSKTNTTISQNSITILSWTLAVIFLVMIILSFWLGGRSKISKIKKSLARGEHPLDF